MTAITEFEEVAFRFQSLVYFSNVAVSSETRLQELKAIPK